MSMPPPRMDCPPPLPLAPPGALPRWLPLMWWEGEEEKEWLALLLALLLLLLLLAVLLLLLLPTFSLEASKGISPQPSMALGEDTG